MQPRLAAAALCLTVASGCHSPAEIHAQPVVWSATYAATYDALANCLATNTMGFQISATPLLYPSERRAVVVVNAMPSGSSLSEFEVKQVQTSPDASEVKYRAAYRSEPSGSLSRMLNETAGRCAKTA